MSLFCFPTTTVRETGLNTPLPNGELPLHLAIREGQSGETIRGLVKSGADAMALDGQGLTAIDHAIIQQHADALPHLLPKKFSEELKAALHSTKQTKHAFQEASITAQNALSRSLSEGEKAILSGDVEKLKGLLKQGQVPNNINGLSPMHLAAMGRSTEIIDLLKRHGFSIHTTDVYGRKPVHYAATNPNGAILGHLLRKGANLADKDIYAVSALSLLGEAARARDPLNLSTVHAMMFAGTVIQAAVSLGISSGLIEKRHQIVADALWYATLFVSFGEFGVQLENINKTWKKGLATLGFFTFEAIPVVGTPLRVWRTYSVANSAFKGIQAAYKNFRYRTWKAARNAVVLTTNAGTSASNLWARFKIDYEICLNGYYLFKIFAATDEEAEFKVFEEYLEFLKNRYGFELETPSTVIHEVDPSELAGLGVLERLNMEKLNPQHPEHALLMIDPTFTMEQLRAQGTKLYTKAFRQLMLKHVHPDKINSPEARQAVLRLNTARGTLNDWVAEHKK